MMESYVLNDEALRLLPKYNGDKCFVALHIRMLGLLDEHDVGVRRKVFPFGFGGIITFGAFRRPVLRNLYTSYIVYIVLAITLIFMSSFEVLTFGPFCYLEVMALSCFIMWILHTMETTERGCFPSLVVHLREAREVQNVLKLHKATESRLVAEVDIDQDLMTLEDIIKGDLERLSGIKYWTRVG